MAGRRGGRELLSASALRMIREHPVFGVGLNVFEEVLVEYDVGRIVHIFNEPVHNMFLLVGSESGIVSLCLLLSAIVVLSFRTVHLLRTATHPEDFSVAVAVMAALPGLTINAMFDICFRVEAVLFMLTVFTSLLINRDCAVEEFRAEAITANPVLPGAVDSLATTHHREHPNGQIASEKLSE